MSPSFELRLDAERYKAGDRVAGTVVAIAGGRSDSLQVHLDFVEKTDDYLDVASTISSGHLCQGDLQTGDWFRFEIALPPDALPNYSSSHGQLYWRVHVQCARRGRDSHELRRIDVAS
ncbi:MAG: hypothetical protein M4D85_00415 [Actinomycetota bacterium]|nr:hypothetical protein [Actinomycetota bacterium]